MSEFWLPRSTCGQHCLPALTLRRRIDPRVALRLAGTAALLCCFALLACFALLPFLPNRHLVRTKRGFARAILATLGVRHRLVGRVPEARALLVANHVSWLDVLVLLAHTPARLLAKHEVRGWPLIGRIARAMGTVFVDRSRPKALPATVRAVADTVAAGGVVAVFPEGTTWCGRNGGRFRPAMFQAAIDARVPVLPVRLDFTLDGEPTTLAAFLGEETLYTSVRRVVAVRGMTVTLRTYPMLHPTVHTGRPEGRRTLARASAAALAREPRTPATTPR
jgi:1-acyl-sn-glycerol-3-phosphate acyltransferase